MIVKQLTLRRKFNLENYETQDIEMTAELEPGESPTEVLNKMKEWIIEQHLEGATAPWAKR